MPRATSRTAKPPHPKRYYRRHKGFPEGIDRLAGEVRGPVTEEQIERWVEELFRPLHGGMKAVVGYVILRYDAWEAAMNVGLDGEGKAAFRATWALEWAYEWADPNDLPEWFFDRLADDFARSPNGSLHRVYAKMLCDRMRFGGVRPTSEQAERLAERCFDLVIDRRTKTAVTFWCLEILAELAPRVDWVAGELPATLRHISEAPDCTPGMRVATRELLRRTLRYE
jgi:hypothetical protein